MFVNVHQVGLTSLYYVHITQPKMQNVPKIATFRSPLANFHQAYGNVMLPMST